MTRHPRMSPQLPRHITWLSSSGLLLVLWLAVSQAQVTLDGSLGPGGALRGPHYTIADSMGQIRGPNLFHSFGQFNLSQGESATFTGPTTIANILGRVTGGSPSSIDGTIRSQIPRAHLYLLNPSGVVFGPNAMLDVKGSFHVSTADYLRLEDGARFFARLSAQSTFSMAPPVAFGFLGPTSASITVNRSIRLQVPTGETFAIVGGDITIVGNPAQSAAGVPTLRAFEGRIHLESVGAAGEVVLSPPGQPPDLEVGSVARAGTVRLEGARIDASTASTEGTGPAGRVRVVARDVRLEGADTRILARTNNSGDGGEVAIHADTLTLLGAANGEARIDVSTMNPGGTGRGGRVTVEARAVRLEGGRGAKILATTSARGAGGEIAIHADTLTLIGEQSQIDVSTRGGGPAGRVRVVARDVRLDGGRILATTNTPGDGGKIDVQAGRLTLTTHDTGNAEINASTENGGAGRGGHVRVVARDVLLEDGARIWTRASAGDGGVIKVRVGTLTLTGEAQISATSVGTGRGGNITVQASEALMIVGQGTSPALIASDTLREGDAGHVVVSAPIVHLDNGRILAVVSENSSGHGGEVEVRGDTITLTRGAVISSGTTSLTKGNGGKVTVVATEAIRIADSGIGSASEVGGGAAGQVFVSAPTVRLEAGGSITASADASVADGGNIQVQARDTLQLRDSQITATVHGGEGGGGNIFIDSTFVILERSQIRADASGGPGGNIRIVAQGFVIDAASEVRASSARNVEGLIDIQAATTPSGLVAPVPLVFASAATLLRSPCAARLHAGTVSTLVERGRAGVPATPDGVLPSRLPLAPLDTATPSQDGGLPSVALVSLLGENQHNPSGALPRQGWAAPADSLRLLGECASR